MDVSYKSHRFHFNLSSFALGLIVLLAGPLNLHATTQEHSATTIIKLNAIQPLDWFADRHILMKADEIVFDFLKQWNEQNKDISAKSKAPSIDTFREQHLFIRQSPNGSGIEITCRHSDPEVAVKWSNLYAKVFLGHAKEAQVTAAEKDINRLVESIDVARREHANFQKEYEAFKADYKAKEKAGASEEALNKLENKYHSIWNGYRMSGVHLNSLERQLETQMDNFPPSYNPGTIIQKATLETVQVVSE